jgi:hypothetical protein
MPFIRALLRLQVIGETLKGTLTFKILFEVLSKPYVSFGISDWMILSISFLSQNRNLSYGIIDNRVLTTTKGNYSLKYRSFIDIYVCVCACVRAKH